MDKQETITRKELKEVIKQTLRIILKEITEAPQKLTGPYTVYSSETRQYYLARKDEETGVYYYLHPDTGTDVPLGREGPTLSVQKSNVSEITTTGAVTPLNLPTWVSRRGGSERGIAGSAALGYELTPIGKKDMNRKQDPI